MKKIMVLFLVMLLFCAIALARPQVVYLYEGGKLPKEETATLRVSETEILDEGYISAVDGKELGSKPEWVEYELLPGEHEILYCYKKRDNREKKLIKVKVTITALANYEYEVLIRPRPFEHPYVVSWKRGERLFGVYRDSIKALNKEIEGLKKEKNNKEKIYDKLSEAAVYSIKLKEPKKAIKYCKEAIKYNDKDFKANALLAGAYQENDEDDKALNVLNDAIKSGCYGWEAYPMIGDICTKMGEYDKAVDAYKIAIIKAPHYRIKDVYAHMAVCYKKMGNQEEYENTSKKVRQDIAKTMDLEKKVCSEYLEGLKQIDNMDISKEEKDKETGMFVQTLAQQYGMDTYNLQLLILKVHYKEWIPSDYIPPREP